MSKSQTLPRRLWITLGLLTIFWGCNWPMMKLALTELSIWSFRGLCIISGSLGLFSIARYLKLPISVPKSEWKGLIAISFFNVFLWNIFMPLGLMSLPAGRTSVIAYTMPVWVVIMAYFFLNEPITRNRLCGLALGTIGLTILIGEDFLYHSSMIKGTVFVLLASVSWAIGTVLIKLYPTKMPITTFTAWQLVVGGLPIAIVALLADWGTWQPMTWKPTMGLLYNMFVVFIFCHWAWYKIATSAPAGVAAISTVMIPVIGVISGMLLLDETPGIAEFSALFFVGLAVATVLIPYRK